MGLLSYRRAVVRNFCPSSHPIQICRRDRRAGLAIHRGRRSGLKTHYRNYFYRLKKRDDWSIAVECVGAPAMGIGCFQLGYSLA